MKINGYGFVQKYKIGGGDVIMLKLFHYLKRKILIIKRNSR